jgi:ABC-type amino acid transport substrate-binding protein
MPHLKSLVRNAAEYLHVLDRVASGAADGFVTDDVLLCALAAGRLDPQAFKIIGKFLTIEPLAIMSPPNDPEFKKLNDDEMKRLIRTREAHVIYERWFQKPIPPANWFLNLPVSYLLKDSWKYPTDQVPG